MAMNKVGDLNVSKRPDFTATETPTPAIRSGPLLVSAQGAILKDDDRLMIAVRVLDEDGTPVVGLTQSNFN